MRHVKRKTSHSHKLATVVTLLMFSLTIVPSMRLGHAQTLAVSSWLYNPVTMDGAITSPEEWAETVLYEFPLRRVWGWPDRQEEPSDKVLTARFKNDATWLYILYKILWSPAETDTGDHAFIELLGEEESDYSGISFNQVLIDLYGWEGPNWFADTDAGGQTNVEGAASHDGAYYWFEFRKMLDSGDGYDWSLTPGEFVDHLGVGIWDESMNSTYEQLEVSLQLAFTSSTLVSCSPNLVPIGASVTCTATVSGSNPTGTVSWSTSSSTGSFSQSVCTLFNGSCSTFYSDNSTGSAIITASYSGDSHNGPSSGSATLTVFINITVGANVTVYPTSDLQLIFSSVTAEGYTTASKTSTVEAPLLADLVGQYYDIRVTATFSGTVLISLVYDDANMTQQHESSLQMMQYTPIVGDIDDYGQVNIMDIALIAASFGTTPTSSRWNAIADLNGDGNINILDISTCAVNFGKTAEWTNVTTYVDTELNVVYGETTHFSIIGIH